MHETPTVYIVDDDEEVRAALALLMRSVGLPTQTFQSADDYLQHFNPERPGVLILDVRMPGMSGLALQEELNKHELHPPIIIITGHGDVPMAVRAVKAGAVDFIEKPFNDQLLMDAIHKAIALDADQRGRLSQKSEIQARLDSLTPREREVLDLIAKGLRNKAIASELNIAQSTVEAHRAKVMDKMRAATLSELMQLLFSLRQ